MRATSTHTGGLTVGTLDQNITIITQLDFEMIT
jgi:hypothetical protein